MSLGMLAYYVYFEDVEAKMRAKASGSISWTSGPVVVSYFLDHSTFSIPLFAKIHKNRSNKFFLKISRKVQHNKCSF